MNRSAAQSKPYLIFSGLIGLSLIAGAVAAGLAESLEEWKDYANPLLGIHMRVKKGWTEIFIKETQKTGSVTFNISADPHISVTAARQKFDDTFETWASSEVLHQLYQPGYKKSGPLKFAGRSCIKVVGISKDPKGRSEQTYFSSQPPYIDQITFSAPQDQWPAAEPTFKLLRESIRWEHAP